MLPVSAIKLQDVFDAHLLEEFLVEVAFDDQAAEFALLQRLLEDVLLDRVDADESVYVHGLGLPDTVAAILRLLVHGWVPVRIVEYDAVGSGEIDADAAAPC